MKVALINGLWIKGGPITYSRCIFESLSQSDKMSCDLYHWPSLAPTIPGAKMLKGASERIVSQYLNENYDLVWFLFANHLRAARFPSLTPTEKIMLGLTKHFMVTCHREDELDEGCYGWRKEVRNIIAEKGSVVSITPEIMEKVKARLPNVKVTLIPLVYPDEPRTSEFRRLSVISTARVEKDKGQDLLIQIAKNLPAEIGVAIYGCRKKESSSNINYEPSFTTSKIWDILEGHSLGVDFDNQEMGSKIQGITLEYMISGVVPVVLENGSRWDHLGHRTNCLKIYEKEDPIDSAMKILNWINDKALLSRIRLANYRLIRDNHSVQVVLPIIEKAISEIAERKMV